MKTQFSLMIDPFLIKILDEESCTTKKCRSNIIAELIAKEYGITLNTKFCVDKEAKKEYQLTCIDNKIIALEQRRKEITEGE